MGTGAWRPDSDLSFLTDRSESQQESILLQALCFQPGLGRMPDVSLSCCRNGRATRCGLLSKVMDTWLPFVHLVFGAYRGGMCSRRQRCPHVGAPPSSTPGSPLEDWCSLGFSWSQGTASTITLNAAFPKGQDRMGQRRNPPAPSFLGSQEELIPQ